MTGTSKTFEIAVYLIAAVGVLLLASWAGSGMLLATLVALVMVAFAVRAAWSSRTP